MPFGFASFIHGHNHRYSYQDTHCPKTGYRIRRVSAPTISTRNKQFEKGWLVWDLGLRAERASVAGSIGADGGDGSGEGVRTAPQLVTVGPEGQLVDASPGMHSEMVLPREGGKRVGAD